MRILLVGSGGVGDAFARIAARRTFFEAVVVADYDLARAERTVAAVDRRAVQRRPGRRLGRRRRSPRWSPSTGITHVMNAVDPRFVMPIFTGAYAAGADYLDMAMSLSQRTPTSRTRRRG